MKRRTLWGIMFLMLTASLLPAGNNSLSDLRGLKTVETRIPVYSRDRLQILFYCAEGVQNGRTLTAVGPVLDIIRRDADIDTIDTGKNTRVYPLDAPFTEVFRFWKGHLFSDGVVVSSKADIDQENQQAAGGEPVFFRAPLLDLNGVGFDGDLRKKRIFVRKDVKIVLRTSGSDPLKCIRTGKMPEKYEFLRGSSDNLLIDMEKRIITLSGHVRVTEERGVIDCDRMRILLPEEGSGKNRDEADELSISGVSKIICDGHVRIRRTGTGREQQSAAADRMDYDVRQGRLRLTGPRQNRPCMIQGKNSLQAQVIEIWRDQEKLDALQDCRLVYMQKEDGKTAQPTVATADRMIFSNRVNQGEMRGRVQIADPRFSLNCGRMTFQLAENGPAAAGKKKTASEITGMPEFAPGGRKELTNMHCYEGVRLVRQGQSGGQPECAEAAEADLQYPAEVVTLSGRTPTIRRGKDTLSGDKLTMHLKKEALVAEPNCRIVVHGNGGKTAGSGAARSVISADRGDLNYGGNLLRFSGHVQVRDPRMALDCRVMDIHLRNAPGRKARAVKADTGADEVFSGVRSQKILDNIVCTGDVRAREPRMKLNCDILTLVFRETNGRTAPGMLQSQGTELVQVLTRGHVRIENIPEKKTAAKSGSGSAPEFHSDKPVWMTADHGKADLVRNVSEFHGHVRAHEEQCSLDCEDLYLYAKNTAPAAKKSAGPAKRNDIDDDPLAAVEPTQVPQTVSIGDARNLDRIVAKRNVVIVRRLAGGEQRATGQQAEYFVARRCVELTGTAPEYAQVRDVNPQNNGRSRKITVFLDRESVQFDGRVQMEFDGKNTSGSQGLPL